VPPAAIADQVDHDVAAELCPIVDREPRGAQDRLRLLGIDVEDRNRQPLGDIGRVAGRAVGRRLGGEADQIVDHDVQRAAGREAVERSKVERFGGDTLAGESRVAVHHHRHRRPPFAVAGAGELGPHPAERDRSDRFEVARVGGEVDAHLGAAGGATQAGGSEVILDVPRAQHAPRVDLLEAGEDLERRATDHPGHDVQAPAMAHRQQRLFGPLLGQAVEHLVEQRHQRGEPFEREALVADVAGVNRLLEHLGPDQLGDQRVPVDGVRRRLHPFRDPATALRVDQVVDLDRQRPAIGRAGPRGLLAVAWQLGVADRRQPPERVERRFEVPPAPVGLEYGRSGGGNRGGRHGGRVYRPHTL